MSLVVLWDEVIVPFIWKSHLALLFYHHAIVSIIKFYTSEE